MSNEVTQCCCTHQFVQSCKAMVCRRESNAIKQVGLGKPLPWSYAGCCGAAHGRIQSGALSGAALTEPSSQTQSLSTRRCNDKTSGLALRSKTGHLPSHARKKIAAWCNVSVCSQEHVSTMRDKAIAANARHVCPHDSENAGVISCV